MVTKLVGASSPAAAGATSSNSDLAMLEEKKSEVAPTDYATNALTDEQCAHSVVDEDENDSLDDFPVGGSKGHNRLQIESAVASLHGKDDSAHLPTSSTQKESVSTEVVDRNVGGTPGNALNTPRQLREGNHSNRKGSAIREDGNIAVGGPCTPKSPSFYGRYWGQFVGALQGLAQVDPCYGLFHDASDDVDSPPVTTSSFRRRQTGFNSDRRNTPDSFGSYRQQSKNMVGSQGAPVERSDLEYAIQNGIQNAKRTNTHRDQKTVQEGKRDSPLPPAEDVLGAPSSRPPRNNGSRGAKGGIVVTRHHQGNSSPSRLGRKLPPYHDVMKRRQTASLENPVVREPPPPPPQQPPPHSKGGAQVVPDASAGAEPSAFPFRELVVTASEVAEITQSVSELTMRSHCDYYAPGGGGDYGTTLNNLGQSSHQAAAGAHHGTGNRRMAYYAVGKHVTRHRSGGADGDASSHRRCYFTGRLIRPGDPFYAGSVQQGLRTLVVFCLPRALGLPKVKGEECRRSEMKSEAPSPPELSHSATPSGNRSVSSDLARNGSEVGRQLAHHDDGGESDSSDGISRAPLDDKARETLLRTLPDPNQELLDNMRSRYPDQFSTLPVQVRSPHCWRLFVKFCFFSGLPIAEGEMHYCIKSNVESVFLSSLGMNDSAAREEVILSHEVMEAVNGEQSAEILRLPNKKTFAYLRKNYAQQSGKLSEAAFRRTSWEVVLPEF